MTNCVNRLRNHDDRWIENCRDNIKRNQCSKNARLWNKSDISLSKKISMGSAVTGKQSSVSFATSSSRSIDRFAPRHGKQCKHVQVNSRQQRNQKSRLGMQMPGPTLLGSSPKPHPRNFLEWLGPAAVRRWPAR